ncbi:acyltransferase [Mariniflexile ostreae]|uniref:Acyltransferase n=1 Tax=Mariniflexile ostreae TaxID=1520892 RepID=A0ABV5FE27_9FLAO
MQIQYFNNLRAFACYLVILTHSAMPAVDLSFGPFMVLFSIMGSPSSELFVTMSSSLLAPTRLELLAFYKKRFSKLIPPFFFWSFIFVIIKFFQNELTVSESINKLLLFPILPVTGVYWFVYAICGLYLIIPIVSPWLKESNKKTLQVILAIWFLTLLIPYLNLIFHSNIYEINGHYNFITVYLGGFIGYLFLGVYLRQYPIIFKRKLKGICIISALIVLGATPLLYAYFVDRKFLEIASHNLSITSALFVTSIFLFFQNFTLPDPIERAMNIIAKYSFGIYLMHILVIRDFVWVLFESNRLSHPLLETPLISLLSLLICLIICRLIVLLPMSRYIIGVEKQS